MGTPGTTGSHTTRRTPRSSPRTIDRSIDRSIDRRAPPSSKNPSGVADARERFSPLGAPTTPTARIAELYAAYHADVRHFLLHQLRDATLADDLTQEVFLHALTARRSILEVDAPRAWLFRIAQRLAIEQFRWTAMRERVAPETPLHLLIAPLQSGRGAWEQLDSARRLCEPPDTNPAGNPEAHLDQAQFTETIRAALSRLSRHQQIALLLYHGGDASYDEIAQALHSRPSGVKMVLSRARRAFRAHYQELLHFAHTTDA